MKNFICIMLLVIISQTAVTAAPNRSPLADIDPAPQALYYDDGTRAVYDIVSKGDNEQWNEWEVWINDTQLLTLVGMGKIDESRGADKIEGSLNDFTFTPPDITGIDTGAWQYVGDSDFSDFKLYFSIKAGNPKSKGGYNLFAMNDLWYQDKNQIVEWTTKDDILKTLAGLDIGLGGKDISHISFWTGPDITTGSANPTPEPATIFFMAFGLIGIVGILRKGL